MDKEILEKLKAKAEAGDAGNQFAFGITLIDNKDAAGIMWLEKAAFQGHKLACACLGRVFDGERGEGIALKDSVKAAYWWTKAAELGYSNAQWTIGCRLLTGDEGMPQDSFKGLYWLTKAAEQGDAGTQFFLGYRLYFGDIVEQDCPKGIYWLKEAAKQGYEDAIHILDNIVVETDEADEECYGNRSNPRVEMDLVQKVTDDIPQDKNLRGKRFAAISITVMILLLFGIPGIIPGLLFILTDVIFNPILSIFADIVFNPMLIYLGAIVLASFLTLIFAIIQIAKKRKSSLPRVLVFLGILSTLITVYMAMTDRRGNQSFPNIFNGFLAGVTGHLFYLIIPAILMLLAMWRYFRGENNKTWTDYIIFMPIMFAVFIMGLVFAVIAIVALIVGIIIFAIAVFYFLGKSKMDEMESGVIKSTGENYYDGKGILRSPGENYYDGQGNLRSPSENYYDYQGNLRSKGENYYDSQGNLRSPGENYYDSEGILRQGSDD